MVRNRAERQSRDGARDGRPGGRGGGVRWWPRVVAPIWERTATAVTKPNVMAAPLWLVADVTIMPTTPPAHTATTRIRMARVRGIGPGSVPDEGLVPDPMRRVGVAAEPLVAVRLVIAEVALVPHDL